MNDVRNHRNEFCHIRYPCEQLVRPKEQAAKALMQLSLWGNLPAARNGLDHVLEAVI
ncbi:hypothetical protein [Paenibacillus sp. LC231]|uniref:hypothetical protein n=1 Tax=Paenibacillus sp. LC231 TaxID=1120679 RepID=UPI0013922A40|nr:hypothetical protein [Paenibacillus sp. LC231]